MENQAPVIYPELAGRVAFVTGGADGLGLEIARAFARQGCKLFLVDRNEAGLAEALESLRGVGAEAEGLAGSVTEERAMERAFAASETAFGPCDIVVANAGIGQVRPSTEISLKEWQLAVDVNLTGVFLTAREAGRQMMAAGKAGTVINMGSMYSVAAAPERLSYCATKAGVAMMTQVLAVEWAAKGIRVNAIGPTYIRTNMVERLVQEGAFNLKEIEGRIPLGRIGTPQNVSDLALFLASDRAAMITGQIVPVDGGWTAYGYV